MFRGRMVSVSLQTDFIHGDARTARQSHGHTFRAPYLVVYVTSCGVENPSPAASSHEKKEHTPVE